MNGILFLCICLAHSGLTLKQDERFDEDSVVVENVRQGTQVVQIEVSPSIIASVGIEIEELDEPVRDVDIYIMLDVTTMTAWQRKRAAKEIIEMVAELKSNGTRQVRLGLGTLVNKQIGSHHGSIGHRRKGRHFKTQKVLLKAKKMLKNCHGKKCAKWLQIKKHHENYLTPIIKTSFRHQMNLTDNLVDFEDVLLNSTKQGIAHPVGSQWEALLQASSCSEIANFTAESQKLLVYINNDGIQEPKTQNHRRFSGSSLSCTNGEAFLQIKKHKHHHGKHTSQLKLSNRRVADHLMQARVRLVAGVPYSKKTFLAKRALKVVPHVEVFGFGKSFAKLGEKAAVKIEEMINKKNGIIHNATWPLIVHNIARPCTKKQLKKAAKKNKPLTCDDSGFPQGWNITVEVRRCSRKKQHNHPIYFEIWAHTYNAVIGVNTTIVCDNRTEIGEENRIENEESKNESGEATETEVGEGYGEEVDIMNENMPYPDATEDPDEATDTVELIDEEAEVEDGPVSELPNIDEEETTPDPDAEIVETRDSELTESDADERPDCSSVKDCVVCSFFGANEGDNCGDNCKVEILSSENSQQLNNQEKCQAKLEDNCKIDYYILPTSRYILPTSRKEVTARVLAEVNCAEEEDDEEYNELTF